MDKEYLKFMEEIVEYAFIDAGIDYDGFRKLVKDKDKIRSQLATLFKSVIKNDSYAEEEVQSSFGYISGYTCPASIREQVEILHDFFPNLGEPDKKWAQGPLPTGAEGFFAVPQWNKIAPSYSEAIKKVMAAIDKKTPIENFYGKKNNDYLFCRRSELKRTLQKISACQDNRDILVIPAQLGRLHRGRSVRRARALMDGRQEFGLGVYEVAIMILTNPQRFKDHADLQLYCPNDELLSTINGNCFSPYFRFSNGKIIISGDCEDSVYSYRGSASFFCLSVV